MAEKSLRAVTDEDRVKAEAEAKAAEVPKSIGAAAEAGERQLLVSLRAHLAREMDAGKVPAHALAGVSKTIREYDREIRAFDARELEEREQKGEREADQRAAGNDEAWTAV